MFLLTASLQTCRYSTTARDPQMLLHYMKFRLDKRKKIKIKFGLKEEDEREEGKKGGEFC
jgi:hypothetical protein